MMPLSFIPILIFLMVRYVSLRLYQRNWWDGRWYFNNIPSRKLKSRYVNTKWCRLFHSHR
jgi:hypothetical protein